MATTVSKILNRPFSVMSVVKARLVTPFLLALVSLSPGIARASGDNCRDTTSGTGPLFSGVDTSCLAGVEKLISNISYFALTIAGTVAVIFIIIGGIQLAVSGGNSSGQEKAKKTITNAIIGLVLAISAGAIGSFLLSALG